MHNLSNDVRTIAPVCAPDVTVSLPGSKSLTNRALVCAALADGVSTLSGASVSDDSLAMVGGLSELGLAVQFDERAATAQVRGSGGHIPADAADLNPGDAGTAVRFLTALCCLGHGRYRVDGSARMRQRPIAGLVEGLVCLGAGVGYDEQDGCLPLTIASRGLPGGHVEFHRPVSSQFISAILLVSPYAHQDVMIHVEGGLTSRPYVDMTLAVLRDFGVDVLTDGDGRFIAPSSQRYVGRAHAIEPDASAATYFWAAAAITGGRVRVAGLSRGSAQGDVAFVDVLRDMGCGVVETDGALGVEGPASGRLRGVSVDLNAMPDTAQTLAVAALFADGPTEIRNVSNLRVKETDRLSALCSELTRLGAAVEPLADGLRIRPPARIDPCEIETYNDHRMAMSFALAGLRSAGISIRGAGCVRKSFPGYFEELARLSKA